MSTTISEEAVELLPCPFCGGPAEHDSGHFDGRSTLGLISQHCGHAIYCADMTCIGCPSFSQIYETEAEAIAAWNRRAALEAAAPHMADARIVELTERLATAKFGIEALEGDLTAARAQMVGGLLHDMAKEAHAAGTVAPTTREHDDLFEKASMLERASRYVMPSRAPAAPHMAGETGWLVELRSKSRPPTWWSLTDTEGEGGYFTPDSLKALRFARKEDAEAYIDEIGWTECFASEHEWASHRKLSALSPAPDAGSVSGEATAWYLGMDAHAAIAALPAGDEKLRAERDEARALAMRLNGSVKLLEAERGKLREEMATSGRIWAVVEEYRRRHEGPNNPDCEVCQFIRALDAALLHHRHR